MGKGYRQGRLGEEIRKLVGSMLLREIKDPRLSGMVSLSAVDITNDGSYATIYVSVLGMGTKEEQQKEKEDVIVAFNSAKGLIKREIGKKIKLRHVPELIFKIDESLEYGRHMSEIIDSLGIEKYENTQDEELEDED